MLCPICLAGELQIHVSLEPQFTTRERRVEVVLPQIVAIQCKGKGCLYPVGETLFKTVEMIYWAGARHVEKLEIIRAHATNEIEVENRIYFDDLKQLTATLQEAIRRYNGGSFHPTG